MPENKPETEPAKTIHSSSTPETTALAAIAISAPTKRGEDFGDTLLPGMAQFQLLARKVKQPSRLLHLVAHVCNCSLPETITQETQNIKGALSPKRRMQLYTWLSQTAQAHLSTLEKVSARVTALTDSFGHQAVMTMLDRQDHGDALALNDPTDKWSRALYLYIEQFIETPDAQVATAPVTRFEQAHRRQSMNQHWNSKDYASHYLGPKDAEPLRIAQYEQVLREQVATLYPGINPELIVIDHHYSEDLSHHRRHGMDDQGVASTQRQHTIAATFNATRAQYRLVIGQSTQDAQVVEVDQPAAIEVVFSWESATGMLGVFCPDPQHRPALASSFQQLVLGMEGLPSQVPMCSFDL
jgi:hypothetical protein